MPNPLKLSIAVTTCNGERYLREQLESFLAQTRLPDEVVISDDASTDSTWEILKEFEKNAPFEVNILHNETRLGYTQNFSRALEQTNGDLVFLSDQDDVWFPEKLETIVALAENESEQKPEKQTETQSETLCWMNDAIFTDAQLQPLGFTKLDQIRKGGYKPEFYVMGCVAALRRPLLDLALPIPKGVKAHDNWLIGLADTLRAKMILDQPLQYYRRHGSNESQGLINTQKGISKARKWSLRIRRVFAPIDQEAQQESIKQQQATISGLERIMTVFNDRNHYKKLLQTRLEREQCLLKAKQIWIEPGAYSFSNRIRSLHTLISSGEYDKAFGLRSAFNCLFSIG